MKRIYTGKRIIAICCAAALILGNAYGSSELPSLGTLASPTTVEATVSENADNENAVYNFLTGDMKLNTAAACGIMGNILSESGFRTTAVGDNNTSYGICQWHNERWTALKSFCSSNGLSSDSIMGQCRFLQHELEANSGYAPLLSLMRGAENTPDGAALVADEWCRSFERPSDVNATSLKRQKNAVELFWIEYAKPANDTTLGLSAPRPASHVMISSGSSGKYVEWLQLALNRVCGTGLTADGIFGSKTEAALKALQSENNISATGKCGPQTVSLIVKLISGSGSLAPDYAGGITYIAPMTAQSISNSTFEGAKWLQASLNKLTGSSLEVDGKFGSATKAALTSFQTANGLTADGVCDMATIKKILSLLGADVSDIPVTPDPTPSSDADKIIGFVEPTTNQSKATYTSEGTKWLQSALNLVKSTNKLDVDGIFGDATHNALIDFQSACGIAADGICGKDTRAKLKEIILGGSNVYIGKIPYTEPTTNQSVANHTAEGTKWVQYAMNALRGAGLKVDGIYGEETKTAVTAYQTAKGLTADGIVGPDTIKAINLDFSSDSEVFLKQIRIASLPATINYYVGDTFKSDGLTLSLINSDDTVSTVNTGFTCSAPDMTTAGTKTVTVSYEGQTTTFSISVAEVAVKSVAISSLPSKQKYFCGESFDSTGMSLELTYTNGKKETTSEYTNALFDSSAAGYQQITVEYKGVCTSFRVFVEEISVSAISIATAPKNTDVALGEEIDTEGLTLLAIYNNGKKQTITEGYTVSCDTSVSGLQNATVRYGTASTTFKVNVMGDALDVCISYQGTSSILIEWSPIEGAEEYYVFVNGKLKTIRPDCSYVTKIVPGNEYSVNIAAYADKEQLCISVAEMLEASGELTKGDVNGDGYVDASDINTLKCYLAHFYGVEINAANSDMNGDGAIDISDVILLARFVAQDTL